VRKRVVEQHRQGAVAGAEQAHELEPLDEVGLLLRAHREPVEVDDGPRLRGLEAHAQVLVDEGVRVAPVRQAIHARLE
jgi:hypothetical protein